MTVRLALLALFTLAGCAKKAPADAPTAVTGETGAPLPFDEADLAGRWESGCVDPGTGQALALDFDLGATDWALDYHAYGDAACAVPFLTVRIEGPYTLGAASAAVPGAREGEFAFSRKTVTPHAEEAVAFLESTYGCGRDGFAVGAPADLAEGCAGLGQQPIATCGQDHDIVLLEGDTLRFGLRPADNDLCTPDKRPTAPSPIALGRP